MDRDPEEELGCCSAKSLPKCHSFVWFRVRGQSASIKDG
jgi:hypothetical protein